MWEHFLQKKKKSQMLIVMLLFSLAVVRALCCTMKGVVQFTQKYIFFGGIRHKYFCLLLNIAKVYVTWLVVCKMQKGKNWIIQNLCLFPGMITLFLKIIYKPHCEHFHEGLLSLCGWKKRLFCKVYCRAGLIDSVSLVQKALRSHSKPCLGEILALSLY